MNQLIKSLQFMATNTLVRSAFIVVFAITVTLPAFASEPVKKSRSNICHDTNSPYYTKTTNYKPYSTIEACLSSGGRLPKSSNYHASTAQRASQFDKSSYDRGYFPHWSRQDGCVNTRHALLRELSTIPVTMSKNGCSVIHGRWIDPYTGITFTNPRELDIDHVIALKEIWDLEAHKWAPGDSRFESIANDPINLFATKSSVNREKGAKGLFEWLPPAESFRCQYALRYVRVMVKYRFDREVIDKHKMRQKEICDQY
jgi:hypothetical protein